MVSSNRWDDFAFAFGCLHLDALQYVHSLDFNTLFVCVYFINLLFVENNTTCWYFSLSDSNFNNDKLKEKKIVAFWNSRSNWIKFTYVHMLLHILGSTLLWLIISCEIVFLVFFLRVVLFYIFIVCFLSAFICYFLFCFLGGFCLFCYDFFFFACSSAS